MIFNAYFITKFMSFITFTTNIVNRSWKDVSKESEIFWSSTYLWFFSFPKKIAFSSLFTWFQESLVVCWSLNNSCLMNLQDRLLDLSCSLIHKIKSCSHHNLKNYLRRISSRWEKRQRNFFDKTNKCLSIFNSELLIRLFWIRKSHFWSQFFRIYSSNSQEWRDQILFWKSSSMKKLLSDSPVLQSHKIKKQNVWSFL